MTLFRFMFRLFMTTVLLCAAALVGWVGVMAGFGSFLMMAAVLVFLAYENAHRAFFGTPD